MAGSDGLCPAHRDPERMKEISALGGAANKAKLSAPAFEPEQLKPIVTLGDAKLALDEIRVGILTRRITHGEGNAAATAVREWVKAEQATVSKTLTDDLRAELNRVKAD